MLVMVTQPPTIWSLLYPFEVVWNKQTACIDILANIVIIPGAAGPQLLCCYQDLKLS